MMPQEQYITNLEQLHGVLLELLQKIDEICARNNIRYFLAYGTELGAVREKGFIKWDDDIDIKVMRKDYSKFKEAMKRELKDEFVFLEPVDRTPYFFDFMPRVLNTKYYLEEIDKWGDAFKGMTNHPAIDVFIVDNIYDNKFKQKLTILQLKILHVLAMTKRPQIDLKSYTVFQRIVLLGMNLTSET